jgi:hypothetical protein
LLFALALVIAGLTRTDARSISRALAMWPVTLALALASGLGLQTLFGSPSSVAAIWPDHYLLPLAAVIAASSTSALVALAAVGNNTNALSMSVGAASGWAVGALGAMIALPGTEYPALVAFWASALTAVALAVLRGFGRKRGSSFATSLSEWLVALAIVPQALVLLPIFRLLYPALGLYSVTALVVAFAPGTLVLGPALSSIGLRGRIVLATATGLTAVVLTVRFVVR